MASELRVKVGQLTGREDFGRGIARIDTKLMKKLQIQEGDVIVINGKAPAVAVRAYPADIGKNLMRIDGLVRKNSNAHVGDFATVSKADVKDADYVKLAPAQKGMIFRVSPNLIRQNLFMRPVNKGDILIANPVFKGMRGREGPVDPFEQIFKQLGFNVTGFNEVFIGGGEIRLMVIDSKPKGIVRITEDTEIEVLEQAVKPIEETKVASVTYEDIGGLKEIVPKVREMIEVPLRRPEIFERLGVEPPKGVLLYGPPGTGKTLLAKAVANEAGAHFISVAGPEFMSKFYGQSEDCLLYTSDAAEN